MLKINDFHVSYKDSQIVRGVSLTVQKGQILVLMGPNGSGKSTLANALMGHPGYTVTRGEVTVDGTDITALAPDQKVKKGLFLAWQNPVAIPGVSLTKLIREIKPEADSLSSELNQMREYAKKLKFSESLLIRSLHDGFSGGEKKKIEMLMASALARKYVIFDEIDTGLDVDALSVIAAEINGLKAGGIGSLVITHYHRLIKLLNLDRVVVMDRGVIVKDGDRTLAERIEAGGYKGIAAS